MPSWIKQARGRSELEEIKRLFDDNFASGNKFCAPKRVEQVERMTLKDRVGVSLPKRKYSQSLNSLKPTLVQERRRNFLFDVEQSSATTTTSYRSTEMIILKAKKSHEEYLSEIGKLPSLYL